MSEKTLTITNNTEKTIHVSITNCDGSPLAVNDVSICVKNGNWSVDLMRNKYPEFSTIENEYPDRF